MIQVEDLVKSYGSLHGRGRGVPRRRPRGDPRLPGTERRGQDHHHPHDRGPAEAHRGPHRDRRPRPRPREPEAAKAALGFIPDRPFLYEKLTAGEFLRFHGGLYGMEDAAVARRAAELLDLFELRRWEDELIESFSHGMKQRLVMCAAFLHRPRAVLVDEPMVGLDPRGARLIKDVFRAMSRRGVAILMSTHTLEVAQEMCDRISIILGGKIIARGTVAELRALAGGEDEQLTPVFLKLTGGSGLQEIDEGL